MKSLLEDAVVHSNVIGHDCGERKHPKPERTSRGSGGKVVIRYEALWESFNK
jgi:hypothetical protein